MTTSLKPPAPPNQTVAHQVIEAMRLSAIDKLYCLPGVQNDDFFNALVDAPDIAPIVTRHEQGAAYMAMGAAQVTGAPAAFCVVPGPGMLNASAALTSSYWAYCRVLGIVGQIATFQQGRNFGSLHDMPDQTKVLEQVTKHTEAIRAATATNQIQTAIDELHSGMPRPVTVEVPVDVWAKESNGSIRQPSRQTPKLKDGQIDKAAEIIGASARPLFVVGSGAYEASSSVIALAEKVQAAVTTRRMGHGVVPTSHPLFVPITAAHTLWKEADMVVGIGTRLEWPLGTWGYDDDLKLVQINLDESELDRHGIGAFGIHGDADQACRAIDRALGTVHRPSRTAELDELRQTFEEQTRHLQPQRSYCAAIRDVLDDDAVIVEDVTQIGFAAHLFYDHRRPRTFLSSGAAGTLGAAPAVAIGAASACDRAVVGVIGDGGFLFTATELATAVQHGIPANLVVFNNHSYGNVRRIQRERFGEDRVIASMLKNPDFGMFARSFGVAYWHADSPDSTRSALAAALSDPGPTLVEVAVDPMPNPWPFFRLPAVRGALARPGPSFATRPDK